VAVAAIDVSSSSEGGSSYQANLLAPTSTGIAALYPGDEGIENHPDVVLVEKFEENTLAELLNRWTDVLNGPAMTFNVDVPPGSPGRRSLNIPSVGGGVNNGGHLYKQLNPAVADTLYVRYYIKYPTDGRFHHEGIWIGGYNPPLAWPNPQAGVKPVGNDRFAAAAEQSQATSRFDHYNYWMNMRASPDGISYWGNTLLNNPNVVGRRGQWMCVEPDNHENGRRPRKIVKRAICCIRCRAETSSPE